MNGFLSSRGYSFSSNPYIGFHQHIIRCGKCVSKYGECKETVKYDEQKLVEMINVNVVAERNTKSVV